MRVHTCLLSEEFVLISVQGIVLISQTFSMSRFVPLINLENYLNSLCISSIFGQIVRSLEDAKTRCSQVHTDKHNIPQVSRKVTKDGTSILFSNILKQKTWFFHNRNSQEVGTNTPDVGRHIYHPLVNTLARILQFPLTRAGETTTRNVSMSCKLSEGDGNGKG